MKASAETLPQAASVERSWVALYADLFKARLTFLVLLTTLVGFYLGFRGPVDYLLMLHTLAGHGPGGQRRVGAEPTARTRARRQDAPHAEPAAAFRPPAAADGAGRWRGCASVLGLVYLALAVNLDHVRHRRGYAGQLSVYLYAAQAGDLAEHGDWRGARRVAAVDGLDGSARTN